MSETKQVVEGHEITQVLDGLPCDCARICDAISADFEPCYEVLLYTSGVDSIGEDCNVLVGRFRFLTYFDAKSFARKRMRQQRPVSPFTVALVTRYVGDGCLWSFLGEYRRCCSGKVTWYGFGGAM